MEAGMAELTYREAVAAGIAQEMERDKSVVFLGEDIAGAGGVFKATVGLLENSSGEGARHTDRRAGILGAAMGAAMTASDRSPRSCSRISWRCAGIWSPTRLPRHAI